MTHLEIKAALQALMAQIGNPEYPWVSFGRVLETMWDIAQHSSDPSITATTADLYQALWRANGPFVAVDYNDTRTTDQLDKAVLGETFHDVSPVAKGGGV